MSFFSVLFGSKTSQSNAVTRLNPEDFKKQVEGKKVQLVDVRTPSEFKSGYIKGAKNIDFFSSKFNVELDKLDKEKPVYVYCRSGNRSRQSAKKMEAMGFVKIYDLKGGIFNLR